MKNQKVWLIADDAKVVFYSELREIYEREGTVRATARVIGADPMAVSRHLAKAGVNASNSVVTALKDRITELEAELKDRGQRE